MIILNMKGDKNMALINRDSFERIEKERNSVHDKVAATYNTFTINVMLYGNNP